MKKASRRFALLMSCLLAGTAAADDHSWTERVKLSGSADLGFFGGGDESVTSSDGFSVWDTRLFVDAELGENIQFRDSTLIRNMGFTFEWNLVRNGSADNNVGLVYLDLEGLAGSPWYNLRVGRVQIPFGEAYKLYNKGYADRIFVHQPIGGPWWWDEGLVLHGGSVAGRVGYVLSATNGDNTFNEAGGEIQLTAKLWAQPFDSVYVSASALWADESKLVDGSIWFGETWGRPIGASFGGPPVVNVIDGAAVANDPDGLDQSWAVALDLIATPMDGMKIWLAGGRYDLESLGAKQYDRALWYWIAEMVVEGKVFSPELQPIFVGARVDGFGTFDDDEGYLLDIRYANAYGYNMESVLAYTAVAGVYLGDHVTLRVEYSHRDVDLVDGAAALVPGETGNEDVYSAEFGLHF